MELFLVRHSKVAVEAGTCYGQWDVALADTFAEEITPLKENLPEAFDIVYSSPLSRCKLLASELHNGSILEDDRLLEMHFGDWENKKWDDLPAPTLGQWMNDFVNQRTPNGENLLDLANRVNSFIEDLRTCGAQKTLIITHSGVIRCFIANLLKLPYENIFKLAVDYGQVVKIKLGKKEVEDLLLKF